MSTPRIGACAVGRLVIYLSLALAAVGACTSSSGTPTDAGALDANMMDGGQPAPTADGSTLGELTHLARLESEADFAALAGEGKELKYLTRVDGREPVVAEECLFQNTARFPYHLMFLRSAFPALATLDFDVYVSWVLRASTRRFWGGGLRYYQQITHPVGGAPGIYTYSAYQESGAGEALTLEQLVEIDRRLKACAPFAASRLVFAPESKQQADHVRTLLEGLRTADVAVRFPEELIQREYEVYSAAEGYGYLHVVEEGAALGPEYGPRDVVVVSSAPSDIAVVAGLVTALPQNLHSHVNLRLREKSIPNAMLASAYSDARIATLRNQLVHVVAGEAGITLESARLEDAARFWDAHRPSVGDLRSNLTVTTLEGLETLAHDDAVAYGTKAANLGELHAILPAANRVEGFAIPFAAYRDYVRQNGFDAEIAALLADPRVRTDRAHRAAALDVLRGSLRRGTIDPTFFAALTARLRALLGPGADTTYVRFRSSTNAEDLEGLSGAGLYDSCSGCLADDLDADELGPSHCLSAVYRAHLEAELGRRRTELAEHPDRPWLLEMVEDLEGDLADEKPVADALRKVWRSLWNLEAFEEREYYGLPHEQVFMGVAVQATFIMEQQEAVVVTNLKLDDGDPVYRVISQLGEVGVVRPVDPTAVAEHVTFRRGTMGVHDVRTIVASSLAPSGTRLWSDAEIVTLGTLLFAIQDRFSSDVYPSIRPLQLDLEVELTHDRRIVIKQARPYVGAR